MPMFSNNKFLPNLMSKNFFNMACQTLHDVAPTFLSCSFHSPCAPHLQPPQFSKRTAFSHLQDFANSVPPAWKCHLPLFPTSHTCNLLSSYSCFKPNCSVQPSLWCFSPHPVNTRVSQPIPPCTTHLEHLSLACRNCLLSPFLPLDLRLLENKDFISLKFLFMPLGPDISRGRPKDLHHTLGFFFFPQRSF